MRNLSEAFVSVPDKDLYSGQVYGEAVLINGDYRDILPSVQENCVDLICADLPFGITQAKFDVKIPMEDTAVMRVGKSVVRLDKYAWMWQYFKNAGDMYMEDCSIAWEQSKKAGLWSQYDRLLKPNGIAVLNASQPFTSYLVTTAEKCGFKLQCEWIWEKTQATGGLNSKKQPMKAHESVLVFVKQKSKGHTYNPQKTEGHAPVNSYTKYIDTQNKTELYGKVSQEISGGGNTDRFPRSVQVFKSDKQTNYLHGCQKPLALVEYFIKTYSNPGDLVLDNVAGSLTTAEACNNLGRFCIAIEKDENYFNKGLTRFK